jgi:hypothetical protein
MGRNGWTTESVPLQQKVCKVFSGTALETAGENLEQADAERTCSFREKLCSTQIE